MHKTSVYTPANGYNKELAHQKQQKSQKVILFSSTLTHSQCDADSITFCDFCCFQCVLNIEYSLNTAVNMCIN